MQTKEELRVELPIHKETTINLLTGDNQKCILKASQVDHVEWFKPLFADRWNKEQEQCIDLTFIELETWVKVVSTKKRLVPWSLIKNAVDYFVTPEDLWLHRIAIDDLKGQDRQDMLIRIGKHLRSKNQPPRYLKNHTYNHSSIHKNFGLYLDPAYDSEWYYDNPCTLPEKSKSLEMTWLSLLTGILHQAYLCARKYSKFDYRAFEVP